MIRDKALADKYAANWQVHAAHSASYTAKEKGYSETHRSEQPANPAATVAGRFVASKNSWQVFHKPDCKSAAKISEKNLVHYATRDEAIAAGKHPCHECNPCKVLHSDMPNQIMPLAGPCYYLREAQLKLFLYAPITTFKKATHVRRPFQNKFLLALRVLPRTQRHLAVPASFCSIRRVQCRGAPINELNAAVTAFKDDLLADALAAKRVEIAVVTFGPVQNSECVPHRPKLLPYTLFSASGDTPMGAAIHAGA